MKVLRFLAALLAAALFSAPAWGQCDCPGQFDPNRNGVPFEVGDMIRIMNMVFIEGGGVTTPTCVCADGDVDCNGTLDVVDVIKITAVMIGDEDVSSLCAPDPLCSTAQCPPQPTQLISGSVSIESRTVAPREHGVQVGVYITNDFDLEAIVLPLEIRSVTPGSFVETLDITVQGRLAAFGVSPADDWECIETYYEQPAASNLCSGPTSGSYDTGASEVPAIPASPFGALWAGWSWDAFHCLPPGSDGAPLSGAIPSLMLTFDVTDVAGTFEIDTSCVAPGSHLLFVGCRADSLFVPTFTKATITIHPPGPCVCLCHADPACNRVRDISDVVQVVSVAFRGGSRTYEVDCPPALEDTDCNEVVDIRDVVHMANLAFRAGDPAVELCAPCGP